VGRGLEEAVQRGNSKRTSASVPAGITMQLGNGAFLSGMAVSAVT
jgi:hypothetical protein